MLSFYDISGHIAQYILKGKSILSKICAYEKPNVPKIEEETSDMSLDQQMVNFIALLSNTFFTKNQ